MNIRDPKILYQIIFLQLSISFTFLNVEAVSLGKDGITNLEII